LTEFVLVTGTNTGVGKTWLACALANELATTTKRVVAIKPIETGGGDDGENLAKATGQAAPKRALVEPATRDASTGTNADALRRRLGSSARIVEIARNGSVSVLAKMITSGA